jgi:hypothetical protein
VITNVQWEQRDCRKGLEEAVHLLDWERQGFLQAGEVVAAARVSIVLILVLAGMGWNERIREVNEELRGAVRHCRCSGEVLFALYRVSNAVAQGTDLHEAAMGALARLLALEIR